MAAIQGLRGTGQFGVDFRPTNYRELFTLLEPNGTAPLNALLSMAASEATDDPKYNHFRDELPDRVLSVNNGAGYDATASVIAVDAADALAFVIPNAILSNPRTNEVMRVISVSNTDITVQRNVGGTAFTITDNDTLAITGYADTEGSGKSTPVSFDATVEFNYTQIFKTTISVTNTLNETYLRTGNKEQEQITKALKLHMGDMERAMFFGRRHIENANSAQPRRYTGGLLSTINNVIDASVGFATPGTITENEFDRVLIENVFAYGSTEKIAFVGARIASNLQKIAKARWQPTMVSGSYGVSMTRYSTFAGDLIVNLHPMFRQIPGMEDTMIILDMPHVKYRYMQNRDTKLMRDIQGNDTDGKEHMYLTECGLELTHSKVHTVIRNWQNA